MVNQIEYLPKKEQFKVDNLNSLDAKNLAVTVANKNDMNRVYPNKLEQSVVSNADMLSQSFGGEPKVESLDVKNDQNPIKITPIPTVQSNFNMEANPVDLSLNSMFDPIKPLENNVMPDINSNVGVEPNNINASNNIAESSVTNMNTTFNQNPIVDNNGILSNSGIQSEFKVSNSGNVFDNPNTFGISQEELNNPKLEDNLEVSPTKFEGEQNVGIQTNPEIKEKVIPINSRDKDLFSDDYLNVEIAIEENNVIHYEALAENSRKKIELLKRQMKNSNIINENLENTASNLFNSNGVLDEDKVLGKTPMPFIKTS